MHKKSLIFLTVISLGAVVMLAACGKKEAESSAEVIRPVKTLTLSQADSGQVRQYTGKVGANRTANLAFQAAGKVVELPIQRGQEVKQGDLLARIDPADFKSTVAEKKARQTEAKADLDRYRKLYEDDAVSLADLQVKEQEYEVALANMQVAEKALSDATLVAPFSGVVAKKFIKIHQNVSAGETAVRVQDNSKIEIAVDVPEKDVAQQKGNKGAVKATATFDAVPDRDFAVSVLEWETEADDATQTFRVKFSMSQPEDVQIMPGMTANVAVIFDEAEIPRPTSRFVIPSNAVFSDAEGRAHVWVINAGQTATKRKIEVGEVTGTNQITVVSGLQPGEVIAIAAIRHLQEGMKVRSI